MPNLSRNDWEELVLRVFFFLVKLFFALLSSTFMRVVFTPVDFDVKQF